MMSVVGLTSEGTGHMIVASPVLAGAFFVRDDIRTCGVKATPNPRSHTTLRTYSVPLPQGACDYASLRKAGRVSARRGAYPRPQTADGLASVETGKRRERWLARGANEGRGVTDLNVLDLSFVEGGTLRR